MDEIGSRIVDQRSCGNMQLCKNHFNANVLIDGNCAIIVLTCQLLLHCLLKCGVKLKMDMHAVKYNSNSCYICKQYFIVRKFSTVLYDAKNMTQTGAHLTHFDKTGCYLEIVK